MSIARGIVLVSSALVFAESAHAQSLTSTNTSLLGLDDVEITPDQHYAVVRQNNVNEFALVFDLTTGLEVSSIPTSGSFCGEVVDAVAVTNTRAVVLGGSDVVILDLTQVGTPNLLLATHPVGDRPNDVAITPDGRLAVVRGGTQTGPGQFVFDLASGALAASAPGLPPLYNWSMSLAYSFDTDSVALTNSRAVVLSIIGQFSATPKTRVTIWDLAPGNPPSIVFETTGVNDLTGGPHDVSISPDGMHAVVRSETFVAGFLLTGAVPTMLWTLPAFPPVGGFGDRALDSVEATNALVITLSRPAVPTPSAGTQVDVIEWNGTQRHGLIPGSPHDLAVSPDGSRAVVRTQAGVFSYALVFLPPSTAIAPVESALTPSSTVGYEDGLDSVAVNDHFAVTLTHTLDVISTDVWFWSIERARLRFIAKHTIVDSRPTDVVLTPDGSRAVVTGTSSISVFHLPTGGLVFEHRPVGSNNFYQWCDGVAATNTKAVGIGQWGPQNGWIDTVDMTPFHQNYCTAVPNSTGRASVIGAQGSTSVSANRLKLTVDDLPAGALGRFVYGAVQTQLPFGDGVQCIAAPAYGLRFQNANLAGSAFYPVDFGQLPFAPIVVGSTWNFQFVHADPNAIGFGFNASNALGVTFTP